MRWLASGKLTLHTIALLLALSYLAGDQCDVVATLFGVGPLPHSWPLAELDAEPLHNGHPPAELDAGALRDVFLELIYHNCQTGHCLGLPQAGV